MKENKLTEKEMQIINLGASIAAGCQPCAKYYVKKCIATGTTENGINEIFSQAEQISTQSICAMQRRINAMLKVRDYRVTEPLPLVKSKNRIDVLVGIAVSYTKNSTDLFDLYINHAEDTGISHEEISQIIETTQVIYSKAKAHVDILRESRGIESKINKAENCSPNCKC